uniref:HepT-like ribonuclease domain-containing protein n=1 Tax=Candidatus Electronema sp. TaxID=2698783 RepID=UPI004055CBE7
MYDQELALELLKQIHESAEIILKRFQTIRSCDDFTGSEWGMEKLDAICMKLAAIGEGLKNFDKVTNNAVLLNYPQIEWKKVKGMRDIIAHRYFDLNAEAVYDVCANRMNLLSATLKRIIDDLRAGRTSG